MSNPPQTYSAAQYLEAGYRAERAGDRDRAAQYYVYLASTFPETPEGEAARGGLIRINMQGLAAHSGVQESLRQPNKSTAHPSPVAAAPEASRVSRGEGDSTRIVSHPVAPAHVETGSSQVEVTHDPARSDRIRLGDLQRTSQQKPVPQAGEASANHDASPAEASDQMRLPDVIARRTRGLTETEPEITFEPRHRAGRLVAMLFVWGGWLTVCGGLALVVLGVIGWPMSLADRVLDVPLGIFVGVPIVLFGLGGALGGAIAIATFDSADNLREVRALLRARMGL